MQKAKVSLDYGFALKRSHSRSLISPFYNLVELDAITNGSGGALPICRAKVFRYSEMACQACWKLSAGFRVSLALRNRGVSHCFPSPTLLRRQRRQKIDGLSHTRKNEPPGYVPKATSSQITGNVIPRALTYGSCESFSICRFSFPVVTKRD